jgi:hypothetical protein
MLTKISQWGRKWHIKFNKNKSHVVHYRKNRNSKTDCKFFLCNEELKLVDRYKYLGVVLQEHLDFTATSEILAGAGGRALGSLLNKYKKLNGLSYNVFTKLFRTCICPILDYGSEIWGAQKYHKIDQIQNRAMRAYLGVHKFAPIAGIQGEMGWTSSLVRRQSNMLRYWNHLLKLDRNRITKRVFLWDREQTSHGWAFDISQLFTNMGKSEIYENMHTMSLENAWAILHEKECQNWSNSVQNLPKLRTFKIFKTQFKTEEYVHIRNRKHRSLLSQLRLGILPLEIETGRWKSIDEPNRLCKLCSSDKVENEHHFLFECQPYSLLRNTFYTNINCSTEEIGRMNVQKKWEIVMCPENVKCTAKYVCSLYEMRQSLVFV